MYIRSYVYECIKRHYHLVVSGYGVVSRKFYRLRKIVIRDENRRTEDQGGVIITLKKFIPLAGRYCIEKTVNVRENMRYTLILRSEP